MRSLLGFAVPGEPEQVLAQNVPTPVREKALESSAINGARQASDISHDRGNTFLPQFLTGNANFGETTVLGTGSIGETTVLSAAQQTGDAPKPYLIRMKNNEKIPLDKPVYRIGKEKAMSITLLAIIRRSAAAMPISLRVRMNITWWIQIPPTIHMLMT